MTAVVSGSESPVVAAIEQALSRGDREPAIAFVRQRAKRTQDSDQRVIEQLISTDAMADRASGRIAPASAGSGTVVGYTHYLQDTVTYLYCSASNCTQVGRVAVSFITDIAFYNDVTLDGDITVTQGPSIYMSNLECRDRDDINNLPDVTVHTWATCQRAEGGGYFSYKPIYPETWYQGGGIGEKYFNEYKISFRPNVASAPTFSFSWQTKRYTIPRGAHAYWIR